MNSVDCAGYNKRADRSEKYRYIKFWIADTICELKTALRIINPGNTSCHL